MLKYFPWTDVSIQTKKQLEALFRDVDFQILLVYGILFIIMLIIIHSINFETGPNPKDHIKRRRWFWGLGLFPLGLGVPAYIHFTSQLIRKDAYIADFWTNTMMFSVLGFIAYFSLTLILSYFFHKGKLGTIFSKRGKL